MTIVNYDTPSKDAFYLFSMVDALIFLLDDGHLIRK